MKKYKLLIFDFDGTLVDTVGDIAYYANTVLADHGYPPATVGAVRQAIGWGVHELLRGLAPGLGSDEQVLEKAVEIFKKRYRETPVRETYPFEHVREMLETRLGKIKKVILTNKPQDITRQILEELDLVKYFECVVGMNAGFPFKPDPTAAIYLMEQSGVTPQETLMIGDSSIDAQTAKNAGMDFGWVRYGYDDQAGEGALFSFKTASEWGVLSP